MPLTSLRRLKRLGELTGVEPAPELIERLAAADSDAERLRIGVGATVDLANAALDAGAPGLHLYTFNEHQSALEVLDKLSLVRPARSASRLNAIARRQLAS
jgi:methylenetetrahydrofolate reductase (NADPH)